MWVRNEKKVSERILYNKQATCFKGPVHCFSMQVVMNKCFLLNPEKKFGTDPCTFNSEKWRHRAKG